MPEREKTSRWVYVIGIAAAIVATVAVNGALRWYEHPFASVLLAPNATVSAFGIPTWAGLREGLRYPDRVLSVDEWDLTAPRPELPARTFTRAVESAAASGRTSVHVRVQTASGVRELDLPIERFGAGAWWVLAGGILLAAGLYVVAALTAMVASPRGPLARTFAKTSLLCAAFLFTFFDAHTTLNLVPLSHVAFAMAPGAFCMLALRLPDDAPLLRRFPWLEKVVDLAGAAIATAMLLLDFLHMPTVALRSACSLLLAASQIFFVVTFITRFVVSRGARRDIMRALLVAVAPPHALLGVGILLASVSSRGSSVAFFVSLPILSLLPLSAVVAFLRQDLWGSRALVSRVVTLAAVGAVACVLSIALGAAFTASLGVPFRLALIGAAAGSVVAAAFVTVALRAGDRGFFPARAEYKPTIEHLSARLTSLRDPAEVKHAVERTVAQWLACDYVEVAVDAESLKHAAPMAVMAGDRVSLPVTLGGEIVAALHVAKKRGGALFTSEDIDLLRTIANWAALAVGYTQSYRELEERRSQEAAAWRGEREALLETLAAEIAHEVRYPINFFRSVFRHGASTASLDAEEIDIGCEEVDRLERLVSGLRRLEARRLERRRVAIGEMVARAELLLRDALGDRRVEVSVPASLLVRCDIDQVTQILVNLLSNALEASGDSGRVGVVWSPEHDGGEIVVWDTGLHLVEDPAVLFAPWFTTKATGTGLGLAITQRLVRAHGWSIDARRRSDRTEFVVSIPAVDLTSDDGPIDTSDAAVG